MEKTFYHYSSTSSLTLKNIRMSSGHGFKPRGIWLSDDSNEFGWADWCKAEGFRITQLRYRYQINTEMKSVLTLDTYDKLLKFIDRYNNPNAVFSLEMIDWGKVALDYSGISFTPYHREWCFMGDGSHGLLTWYSAIDCDSACIWDKSIITYFGKPELTGIEEQDNAEDYEE